ncbi:ribosome silencing factor [Kocuria soli]|uniref:Ribosomal silencing factor RsfS n=1 Tax=Kocuria soli TaxID=2485125 RepID=A0A3N4AED0_9MICC|nr:ribosome silencing factor [Kocuria soli]ROZ64623.1 ribosome silencing factor [Kocuria soli]
MTLPDTSLAYLRTAARAADEKQAENIVALDVSEALGIVDSFLVASGSNERLVSAIVDAIEDALIAEHDLRPLRREGKGEGRWVLLDYGDVVVHVQHDEDRAFYALERLWSESPVVDLGLSSAAEASASDSESTGADQGDLHGAADPS